MTRKIFEKLSVETRQQIEKLLSGEKFESAKLEQVLIQLTDHFSLRGLWRYHATQVEYYVKGVVWNVSQKGFDVIYQNAKHPRLLFSKTIEDFLAVTDDVPDFYYCCNRNTEFFVKQF